MEKMQLQKTALGMVETVGLIASVEAADAMTKVANVSITCQEEKKERFRHPWMPVSLPPKRPAS